MTNSKQIEQLPASLFEHHRDEEQYRLEKTMPPSVLIPRQLGRACLLRLNNEKGNANRTVRSARRGAKKFPTQRPKPSMTRRFSIEMMAKHYGDYVLHADNSTGLQHARKDQHLLELAQIKHGLRAISGAPNRYREDQWVGFINELTVQALLNRGTRDDMAGLPALTHHERGAVDSTNYDVLACLPHVEDNDMMTTHKLQIKSSAYSAKSAEDKFEDDIVIVCAEDALDYRGRTDRTSPKFPVAHLMLAEQQGGSESLTQELDSATIALQQTILNHTVKIQAVA